MSIRSNNHDCCSVSFTHQNLPQTLQSIDQISVHQIEDIIKLFNDCFFETYNTKLVKGNDEPIYLPAGKTDINIPAQNYAQVVFAHGYYASALHEIAHWCLAGEQRRTQIDFGYWYCPDGRTAEQQKTFQQAEIKPQSIEWALCIAAGFKFNVSCDNLSGDEFGNQPDSQAFEQQILKQINTYLENGFPSRTELLMVKLAERYLQKMPTSITQFIPSFKTGLCEMPKEQHSDTLNIKHSRVKFRLGLIINPIAGIGGSVGLKGSDGVDTPELAKSLGAQQKANDRACIALSMLSEYIEHVDIFTVARDMGQSLCEKLGFAHSIVYAPDTETTTFEDTENAAKTMAALNLDLILFVGGDGTARNICAAVEDNVTVLGVPAGCKIHSGVYAITPKAAGRVLQLLVTGELVTVSDADVMDIDEEKFRQGIVKARRYGELSVPSELRFIQNVKMGGKESDELVLNDIAAHVIELMEPEQTYIMGSGSTVAYLMEELSLPNTLLGVDVIQDHNLLKQDVIASELLTIIDDNTKLVITLIGGQGHIFGRGNQQLSPEVIKKISKDNILVIATKTKLKALNGRPLIVDTGDEALDKSLSGHIKVITGYHDQVLYPVGYEEL